MPVDLALLARLVPILVDEVGNGISLIKRLQAGDMDAVKAAQDWLGMGDDLRDALSAWEASKIK